MAYYLDETTLTDELIAFLFSCKSNSIRKKILWERVQKRRNISKSNFNQSLYRLKKRGIIHKKKDDYILSEKGISFYKNYCPLIKKQIDKKNRILIIFDIPENKKRIRDWIRLQIKFWDFKMIQKSVWAGYGPLPDEFGKRLKLLGVDKGVKILNIQKKY